MDPLPIILLMSNGIRMHYFFNESIRIHYFLQKIENTKKSNHSSVRKQNIKNLSDVDSLFLTYFIEIVRAIKILYFKIKIKI